MRQLSPTGEQIIAEIAGRHGFGVSAVKEMLEAIARGGGTMAQFNNYEFGGGGQWLRGGMIMIGDMFNNHLKSRVDALCSELSNLIANDGGEMFARAPQYQSQNQSGGYAGGGDTFASWQSQSGGNWWPEDLGSPASVGAQNDMRYAYFPDTRRLALSRGGHVEVLDTGDHNIHGFGQQQGGGDSITLSSQFGTVPLSSLRRIEMAARQGESPRQADSPTPAGADFAAPNPDTAPDSPAASPAAMPDFMGTGPAATPIAEELARPSTQPAGDTASILSLLEKLGELRDKGVLSEEEFAAKKGELLKRL